MALDRMGGVTRRTFVKGGLAASALAALAACKNEPASTGDTDTTATSGGTFKFYINDPVAIDPYNLQESEGTQVGHILFDSLVGYDWDTGEYYPKACEKWEVSEDGTEFTFTLKDATFHNGDPVNSEAFKRGWQRLVDPKMKTPGEIGYHIAPVVGYDEMLSGEADEISGLTCPDEKTFVVKLSSPMADFIAVCAHPGLAPVPQAAIDDPDSFLLAPIGNGPFQMDGKWESGQYINVKRYDDYYGEPAKLDAINFSIQKDPDTAFREFEAGNLDFCQLLTGRIQEGLSTYGEAEDGYTVTPGKQALVGAEASVYYLTVNVQDPVMSDINVRHAASLAINRQNIVDTLFEGVRTPADCVFPPLIDEDSSNAWEYSVYDPERAKQIIADNGLEGTEITLSYNSGGGHEDIMSIIQGDLEAVGFKVTQNSQEWAAYLSGLTDGNFQIARMGWIADYPTLDNFIYPNFYSTADNNFSKYASETVDAAIDEARTIVDEEERKAAFRAINHQVAEDLPIIPIMFYAHNHVGSERVENFFYDPQGKGDFATATIKA